MNATRDITTPVFLPVLKNGDQCYTLTSKQIEMLMDGSLVFHYGKFFKRSGGSQASPGVPLGKNDESLHEIARRKEHVRKAEEKLVGFMIEADLYLNITPSLAYYRNLIDELFEEFLTLMGNKDMGTCGLDMVMVIQDKYWRLFRGRTCDIVKAKLIISGRYKEYEALESAHRRLRYIFLYR